MDGPTNRSGPAFKTLGSKLLMWMCPSHDEDLSMLNIYLFIYFISIFI